MHEMAGVWRRELHTTASYDNMIAGGWRAGRSAPGTGAGLLETACKNGLRASPGLGGKQKAQSPPCCLCGCDSAFSLAQMSSTADIELIATPRALPRSK